MSSLKAKIDEAAKDLFAFAGDKRTVEIVVETSRAAIAKAMTDIAREAASRAFQMTGEYGEPDCWCAAHEKEFVDAVVLGEGDGELE